MGLKYVIAGTGATGGCIGGFLGRQGADVTFLSRGAGLSALKEKGLTVKGGSDGGFTLHPVKACTMDEYAEVPDVVFVCVKWYSIGDATSFLRRTAVKGTVVIPILNIYGTGEKLQAEVPDAAVTDGCIYVAAHISAPGEVTRDGDIFRVVYGLRPGREADAHTLSVLKEVESDMKDAGITPVYTDRVKRDTFKKFAYTSPMAAAGEYFHATAGAFQTKGAPRDHFAGMIRELEALAKAMDLGMDIDLVETNLDILDALSPAASTSMQRDIEKGGDSEISGLVYAVEDMAEQYGVEMPIYHKVITELKARGLR